MQTLGRLFGEYQRISYERYIIRGTILHWSQDIILANSLMPDRSSSAFSNTAPLNSTQGQTYQRKDLDFLDFTRMCIGKLGRDTFQRLSLGDQGWQGISSGTRTVGSNKPMLEKQCRHSCTVSTPRATATGLDLPPLSRTFLTE